MSSGDSGVRPSPAVLLPSARAQSFGCAPGGPSRGAGLCALHSGLTPTGDRRGSDCSRKIIPPLRHVGG